MTALTADEHAARASELLQALDGLAARMDDADQEQRLEWLVTGVMRQVNADQHWTAELAIAHALTALALGGR